MTFDTFSTTSGDAGMLSGMKFHCTRYRTGKNRRCSKYAKGPGNPPGADSGGRKICRHPISKPGLPRLYCETPRVKRRSAPKAAPKRQRRSRRRSKK